MTVTVRDREYECDTVCHGIEKIDVKQDGFRLVFKGGYVSKLYDKQRYEYTRGARR